MIHDLHTIILPQHPLRQELLPEATLDGQIHGQSEAGN